MQLAPRLTHDTDTDYSKRSLSLKAKRCQVAYALRDEGKRLASYTMLHAKLSGRMSPTGQTNAAILG